MPILPSCRNVFWSASLLGLLLLPGTLWGEQTFQNLDDSFATVVATDDSPDLNQSQAAAQLPSVDFVPNWKRLLSLCTGDDFVDPSNRFFVNYETMLFGPLPMPASHVVDSSGPNGTRHAAASVSIPMPAGSDSKSFASTFLENLGPSAIGSLFPNLGPGSRLEFGRMDSESTGWSVSVLEIENSGQDSQSPGSNRASRSR
jgi:hypothetical protein